MCNLVYVATDSDEDLTRHDSVHLHFLKEPGDPALAALTLPHRWFVGSRTGCSCGFRHWASVNPHPAFWAPEDWYPEDGEDLASTQALYRIIEGLVSAGHRVECLDTWNGEDLDSIREQEVHLGDVPIAAFRLFEGYRFRFEARAAPGVVLQERP
jgi:hypothetical protein